MRIISARSIVRRAEIERCVSVKVVLKRVIFFLFLNKVYIYNCVLSGLKREGDEKFGGAHVGRVARIIIDVVMRLRRETRPRMCYYVFLLSLSGWCLKPLKIRRL